MVNFYGPEEAHGALNMDEKSPDPTTRVEAPPALWVPQEPPPWRETDAKKSYKSWNPQKET